MTAYVLYTVAFESRTSIQFSFCSPENCEYCFLFMAIMMCSDDHFLSSLSCISPPGSFFVTSECIGSIKLLLVLVDAWKNS